MSAHAGEAQLFPAPVPGASTPVLLAALISHYRKPGMPRDGCILLTEAQAPGGQRRCDLIHIGVASRGRGIDAHELKVSRSDWLRELDEPAKADAWWPYCSRWWIVAPPGIVRDGELPIGWGLMEPPPRGRRFKVRVQAPSKEPQLTLGLLAELLCSADNGRLTEMDAMRRQHRADLGKQDREIRAEAARRGLDAHTRDRLEILEAVEAAIGMEITEYAWRKEIPPERDVRPQELAAALDGVKGHVSAQRLLAEAQEQRAALAKAAERVLAELGKRK